MNRRQAILAGLGGAAAVLASGFPAQATARPARMVVFYSGNGTIHDAWAPPGTGGPLTELPPIVAPLAPHIEDVALIDGLRLQAGGVATNPHHLAFGCLLTGVDLVDGQFLDTQGNYYGSHGGPSVDQVIADSLAPPTPFRSLEIGVQSGKLYPSTSLSKVAARGPRQLLHPENDPFRLFDRVFGGGLPRQELSRIRAEKASVLDYAIEDLDQLQSALAREERARLEAHLDGLRSIERRLQVPMPACETPTLGAPFDIWTDDNFPEVARLHAELLALAFSCDLTRVATFMFSESSGQTVYRWLGVHSGHHDLSHAGDSDLVAREQLISINAWIAEQISHFASRLKELPDVGGSAYDNTLIVWANDLGKGNEHTLSDVPFVVLGGAGGAIAGQQHIRVSDRWHTDLLLTLCHAMGVPRATFGAPESNQGPITELLT